MFQLALDVYSSSKVVLPRGSFWELKKSSTWSCWAIICRSPSGAAWSCAGKLFLALTAYRAARRHAECLVWRFYGLQGNWTERWNSQRSDRQGGNQKHRIPEAEPFGKSARSASRCLSKPLASDRKPVVGMSVLAQWLDVIKTLIVDCKYFAVGCMAHL